MKQKQAYKNIQCNLIIGFLGVGKSTAIRHLLAQKPAGETWAVLVNEFGQVGIDAALIGQSPAAGDVVIKEIPGGCLCCVGSSAMTIGLNRLIQKAKPDRILIEPTGLGHPAKLIEKLQSEFYKDVIDMRACISLVDARNLSDERYKNHVSFIDQIAMADVLLANKADLYTPDHHLDFLSLCQDASPTKAATATVNKGQIDADLLDLPHNAQRVAARPDAHAHAHNHDLPLERDGHNKSWALHTGDADGFLSVGWVIDAAIHFDSQAVIAWACSLNSARFKAVLHCSEGWVSINGLADEFQCDAIAAQAESRVQCILQKTADTQSLPDNIDACLKALARSTKNIG